MKTETPVTNQTHPLNHYLEITEAIKTSIGTDRIGADYFDQAGQIEIPSYGSLSDGHFMVFDHGCIIAEIMAVGLDDEEEKWLAIDDRLHRDKKNYIQMKTDNDVFYVLTIRLCDYDEMGAHGADHGADLNNCFESADRVNEFIFVGVDTAKKAWASVAACLDLDGV